MRPRRLQRRRLIPSLSKDAGHNRRCLHCARGGGLRRPPYFLYHGVVFEAAAGDEAAGPAGL
jgi:hypothetical protein